MTDERNETQQEKRIATVSQINTYIKGVLERVPVIQDIWVRGEISNFKNHYSGHMYFTLKDEGSVLRSVMFKGANARLTFVPENGMKVLARGRVGVFPRDGQYQLYVEEMEEDGIGSLYREFEKLKAKLAEEGLFDEARKRPIPRFPHTIGVITSGTGAAVRDILNILGRRYPLAKVLIAPVLVQGPDASPDIVRAIRLFNRHRNADVLIVGRGGGSIEDLWAFNEESTARAIAESEIPVISAVGHETDFTISDFAADLRAPTPSAAAELAVPDMRELAARVASLRELLKKDLTGKTVTAGKNLERLANSAVLTHPMRMIDPLRQTVDGLYDHLLSESERLRTAKGESLLTLSGKLDAMSPLKVLSRGYSIATKESGAAVRKTGDVTAGESITLRVTDGSIRARVTEE